MALSNTPIDIYYDKNGKPIDRNTWSKLFECEKYRSVGLNEKNGIIVSTVWLGLDHGLFEGKPLIFETMVFGGPDEVQERYSTMQEAIEGHNKMVEKYHKQKSAP